MASALPGVFSGQAFDFGYHSSFKAGLFAGTGLFDTGICETAAGTVNHLVLNDVAHTGQKKKQRKRPKRIKKNSLWIIFVISDNNFCAFRFSRKYKLICICSVHFLCRCFSRKTFADRIFFLFHKQFANTFCLY